VSDTEAYHGDVERAMRFAVRRASAEAELIAAVLAAPRLTRLEAQDAGLKPWHFACIDLKTIYTSVLVCGDRGIDHVLIAARELLRRYRCWDDTQAACNWPTAMRWSDAALARIGTTPYLAGRVDALAHHVIDLYGRWLEAQDCLRRVAELLADETYGAPVTAALSIIPPTTISNTRTAPART
jgi:hypothetical protein